MEAIRVPNERVESKKVRSLFMVVSGTIGTLKEGGKIDQEAFDTLKLACKFFHQELDNL